MKKATHHVVLFLLLRQHNVIHAGSIRLCARDAEGTTDPVPLVNASVACFDEDPHVSDDVLGSSLTGASGCAVVDYEQKVPGLFQFCHDLWDCWPLHNPDIYCRVAKDGYLAMTTETRMGNTISQSGETDLGTLRIYPDRVARGDIGGFNGCGPASNWPGINAVVDFLTGFGAACNNHDLCYTSCAESHDSCDDEFLDLMYSECDLDLDTDPQKSLCKTVADGMYQLVHNFGGPIFYDAQEEFCNKACPGSILGLCFGEKG